MPVINNRELSTVSYELDIKNFESVVMLVNTGSFLASPTFNRRSINQMWEFIIYPKGRYNEEYIAFFLLKLKKTNQAVYNFTLSVGKPGATPVKSTEYTGICFGDPAVGEELFLSIKSSSWISKGPVRFRCDISEVDHENRDVTYAPFDSYFYLKLADTENLSLDLEELFLTQFRSDLTVNLNGNEICIHKYMLQAGCSEICLEFGYDSIMQMPEIVETEIGHEIFKLLMHYVYTGKLGDSHVPLELLRCAERLGLVSLIQCLYEPACSYSINSEAEIEKMAIQWNLDELEFFEKGSTYVHILRTPLYAKRLAIQVGSSDDHEKEKFINVSFKFYGFNERLPIILISKISLTSRDGPDVFREVKHIFSQDEQWNFPRLLCQRGEGCSSIVDAHLMVELSMFDWSKLQLRKRTKTRTKLYTKFQTVSDNLGNLSDSMGKLLQMSESTGNLDLLSEDGKLFRVHDAIIWARWPGVKGMIDDDSVVSLEEAVNFQPPRLKLNLPSEVLNILLSYLYTGFIENFDKLKAEMLLRYRNEYDYPDHLLKKCEDLWSVNY